MTRISMSLPTTLLNEFDHITQKLGYQSRSKAIRNALTQQIQQYQWNNQIEEQTIGTLTINYNYQSIKTVGKLNTILNKHQKIIISTINLHRSSTKILDLIIIKADYHELKKINKKITTLNGVEYTKLNIYKISP